MNLEQVLTKYATKDINAAKNKGEISIVNTKHGNISIQYNNRQYMIMPMLDRSYAHYVGSRKGAIQFMKTAYQVVAE
jgi:hypothetical protein